MPDTLLPLIAKSVLDFLRGHAPFAQMQAAHLDLLVASAQINYFPAGTRILAPEHGPPQVFYVIQRGSVRIHDAASAASAQTEPALTGLALTPGDSFPLGAMIAQSAVVYEHTAAVDTFCYEFPRAVFDTLQGVSAPFAGYCSSRLAHLLQESRRRLHAHAAEDAHQHQNMTTLLGALMRKPPLTCAPGVTLRAALALMREHRTGSIVVTTGSGSAAGIFTERDLLNRVVLGDAAHGVQLDIPVQQVMTPDPYCLDENASAFDAALLMTRHGVRHVPVTRGEKVIGVVSERDLFSLQRAGLRDIHQAIRHAADATALANAAADVRVLARNLLAQGMGVNQLTQLIVALNDQLVQRAVTLTAAAHGIDDIDYCWIALGSEGRMEQTISTDQDNGLIFTATGTQEANALRARLLPVAAQINALLARLGFPLCRGGIMAGNPQWCLSLAEWQARFSDWLRTPSPEALLHAAIFFDFRALHGNLALTGTLRSWLQTHAPAHPAFLHLLAANALQTTAPLGFFGDLASTGKIDLKTAGARPFIDAARVLALAHGVHATHTAQRLRLVADVTGTASEAEAVVEAFEFIQMQRLTCQINASGDGVPPNEVDLASLNELDRRILREAFRQSRKLQTRLRLDYAL